MENKNSNFGTIALTAIVTAIVVGGAIYWQGINSNMNGLIPPTAQAADVKLAKKPMNLVDKPIIGTEIKKDYGFKNGTPEKFTSLNGGGVIFMKMKAMGALFINNEKIESFAAPVNPVNKDMVFISTKIIPDKYEGKITSKIYSYNIRNGELVKIYEEHGTRLFRTMGMDGSKLIIMNDLQDNTPGPCFMTWADWSDFSYLELADIGAGLKPYTVPAYKVEEANEDKIKCEQEMGF